MRCHRTKPKSLERSQSSSIACTPGRVVHSKTKRRRCGLPCRSLVGIYFGSTRTAFQDLGNTNFSIHLPRQSFDRHFTSSIVLKAVQSLGIDAHLNERNDICVGEEKMSESVFQNHLKLTCRLHVSGSAYKIVNKRAYHHGTMLISTRLDTLGNLLRSDKVRCLYCLRWTL